MTTYAYDDSATQLFAVWETGLGAVARPVARLHARTPSRDGVHLAKALSGVSEAAWCGYSDPGLVDLEPAEVLRAVRRPHQPRAGLLYREGDPPLECANEAGRRLAAVGSAGVTRAEPAVLATRPETDRMEAARQVFDAQVRVEAERSAERLLRTGRMDLTP